jgi:Protein of unknown function (DUF4232)
MQKKQIIARRAVAASGLCLVGLMLTACQSGAAVSTANGGPATGASGSGASGGAGTGAGAGAGGVGIGASTAAAANSGNGSSTGSGGAPSSGSGSGSGTKSISPANPPALSSGGECKDSQLQLSTGAGDSGDGNFDMVLIFKNTSAESCTITGYAGAAVDYDNGTALNAQRHMAAYLGGDSADTTPPTVTLNPGASASDLLNWSAGPTSVECLGTGTAKMLVTPPGTTNTVTLSNDIGGACENFSVTPVVPGTSGDKQ